MNERIDELGTLRDAGSILVYDPVAHCSPIGKECKNDKQPSALERIVAESEGRNIVGGVALLQAIREQNKGTLCLI